MKLSRNELASVRTRQKLRYNKRLQTWEVYTFVEPNYQDFKWYAINDGTAEWYCKGLQVPIVPAVELLEPEQQTSQPIAT